MSPCVSRRIVRLARILAAGACFAASMALPGMAADETSATGESRRAEQKAQLAACNGLIGEWRGAGQLRRGSNRGAWVEAADWVWDFSDGVAIRCAVTDGRHLKGVRLTYDVETDQYELAAVLPDDSQRRYAGTFEGNRLVVESSADGDGEIHRLTLTQLNDKRTLVLFEKRRAAQTVWQRVAEVGYTREGTRLAERDSTGPECIVTGGAGTIAVTYRGRTYHVCCSGCRQAFEADPEGVLAEYAARSRHGD